MWVELSRPLGLLALPVGLLIWGLLTWRFPRKTRKAGISRWLRAAMLLLTALSLAGVSLRMVSPDRAAWLVVDVSASVNEGEALSAAREALAGAEKGMKVGVIAFGKDSAVEVPLREEPELNAFRAYVDRSASNLKEALELAQALMPEDAGGGIGVISDGLLTLNGTDPEESMPVNAYVLSASEPRDAQLTSLSVPSTLYAGQKYSAVVTVHATEAGEATLLFLENQQVTETRGVTLRKGENTFAFTRVAEGSGVSTYEAQIMMDGDQQSRNDRAGALTTVLGEPVILIAEGRTDAGAELEALLQAAGMTTRRLAASQLPRNATELWSYGAICLVNVDADSLSEEQVSALSTAARELGCGVAVFGGDASYALGNYRGSALEELLPVTLDIRNRMNLPSVALVLCIDKSGSMMDSQYGVSRLDVAKEAACRALEVLTERDSAGVIAFDDEGKWVVPLTEITDVAAMQAQIGTIRSGGGTAFYTPLVMAHQALKDADAQYRHVIFLTDGEAGDRGYEAVVRQMAEDGITVTTVAAGDGADIAGLELLAKLGGGRAYAAGQFDHLPKIFTKETMLISGAYVQNRVFTPVVTDTAMTGFDGFPPLSGYLATALKPLATASLVSDRDDPILAWWQVGAGKVLAWTSDVEGGWSEAFLRWEEASSFFGGMVSFLLPTRSGEGRLSWQEGQLVYRVNAPANTASAQATVLKPDGTTETLTLTRGNAGEDAEAVFFGPMETETPGSYAVQVALLDASGNVLAGTEGGVSIPWAAEYDQRMRNTGALETLARRTGGEVGDSPEALLRFPAGGAEAWRDLTPWLMSLCGLLLLLDIAQRRLGLFPEQEKGEQEEKLTEKEAKKPERAPQEKPEQEKAADVLFAQRQKRKRM